jgi:hypothetical protein
VQSFQQRLQVFIRAVRARLGEVPERRVRVERVLPLEP